MRLAIVSALAVNRSLSFNELKGLLDTTDGNLSVHARKLEDAGYIVCTKSFEGRVPADGVSPEPAGPSGIGAVPRPHGSPDPQHARTLNRLLFLRLYFMAQRPSQTTRPAGLHVGIIMDGNGRWATARGLPRPAGHRAGVDAVRRVVEAAPEAGVGVLTLFAFSADNWRRPATEVAWLMRLFRDYLDGRDRPLRIQRRTARDHRTPRPAGHRAASGYRGGRSGDYLRLEALVASGGRLFLPRRDPPRSAVPQAGRRLEGILWPPYRHRGSWVSAARAGPADPDRRGAAPQRLPAVGGRLRGVVLHAGHVARLRSRRPASSPSGFRREGTAVRGSAGHSGRLKPGQNTTHKNTKPRKHEDLFVLSVSFLLS